MGQNAQWIDTTIGSDARSGRADGRVVLFHGPHSRSERNRQDGIPAEGSGIWGDVAAICGEDRPPQHGIIPSKPPESPLCLFISQFRLVDDVSFCGYNLNFEDLITSYHIPTENGTPVPPSWKAHETMILPYTSYRGGEYHVDTHFGTGMRTFHEPQVGIMRGAHEKWEFPTVVPTPAEAVLS